MKFKVGDNVKIVKTTDEMVKQYLNRTGKILRILKGATYPYEINFDDTPQHFEAIELQLITTRKPKYFNKIVRETIKEINKPK